MEDRSPSTHIDDEAGILPHDSVLHAASMRIFLAGATGVIGVRLLRLMLAAGHEVAAMTRTPKKLDELRTSGAIPVLGNILDQESLSAAIKDFHPDLIVHQVTDLPDEIEKIAEFGLANARIRSVGTRNLLAAAQLVGASGFLAQSIAWPGGAVLESHENAVLLAGGTVLRYGRFYGQGTYYEDDPPPHPRIHVDVAARRTMAFLRGLPGVFSITETETESRGDTGEEQQYARHDR
jgi:NAD(P)H-binding